MKIHNYKMPSVPYFFPNNQIDIPIDIVYFVICCKLFNTNYFVNSIKLNSIFGSTFIFFLIKFFLNNSTIEAKIKQNKKKLSKSRLSRIQFFCKTNTWRIVYLYI